MKTENDLKHVGWVATRRISFIGGGLMLKHASSSIETISLTPISKKGLFKTHEAPALEADSACMFTLKRNLSHVSEVKGRKILEGNDSQRTLVDVLEVFSRCSLNEEDRFSNTSFCTAQEEYCMTDLSASDNSENEDKRIPNWAQYAEAAWLKAKTKWEADAIFKLVSLNLDNGLSQIFARQMARPRKSSGQW